MAFFDICSVYYDLVYSRVHLVACYVSGFDTRYPRRNVSLIDLTLRVWQVSLASFFLLLCDSFGISFFLYTWGVSNLFNTCVFLHVLLGIICTSYGIYMSN